MTDLPLLTILVAVPLIAGIAVPVRQANGGALDRADRDAGRPRARRPACGRPSIRSGAQWQFVENLPLGGGITWALGIDGIALMLIMLTVFLMPICIGASWRAIDKRVPEYMAAFLLMEALMIGVFAAQDLFLFYIFFEGGLIPMYLIIGIWGGAERIKASYKFFLYTLLGSVLMLIAMLWMVLEAGTTSIPALMAYDFPVDAQTWLWLAFFASFAVKMPMWPVHTWLPDAHVQAPTAGSVILAGVLLKMGGYGFIRFSLPMFPEGSADVHAVRLRPVAASRSSTPAWSRWCSSDMKKLIAYSSVAHMAFVTFGLFAFNRQGIEGAMIVMLEPRPGLGRAVPLRRRDLRPAAHPRDRALRRPCRTTCRAMRCCSCCSPWPASACPGTSGFVGEFLSLVGTYQVSSWAAIVATTGIILGAAYMLYLYWRICFGVARTADAAAMPDLKPARMVAARPRSPPACSGWASIRKASSGPMRADVGRVARAASSARARRATRT